MLLNPGFKVWKQILFRYNLVTQCHTLCPLVRDAYIEILLRLNLHNFHLEYCSTLGIFRSMARAKDVTNESSSMFVFSVSIGKKYCQSCLIVTIIYEIGACTVIFICARQYLFIQHINTHTLIHGPFSSPLQEICSFPWKENQAKRRQLPQDHPAILET